MNRSHAAQGHFLCVRFYVSVELYSSFTLDALFVAALPVEKGHSIIPLSMSVHFKLLFNKELRFVE